MSSRGFRRSRPSSSSSLSYRSALFTDATRGVVACRRCPRRLWNFPRIREPPSSARDAISAPTSIPTPTPTLTLDGAFGPLALIAVLMGGRHGRSWPTSAASKAPLGTGQSATRNRKRTLPSAVAIVGRVWIIHADQEVSHGQPSARLRRRRQAIGKGVQPLDNHLVPNDAEAETQAGTIPERQALLVHVLWDVFLSRDAIDDFPRRHLRSPVAPCPHSRSNVISLPMSIQTPPPPLQRTGSLWLLGAIEGRLGGLHQSFAGPEKLVNVLVGLGLLAMLVPLGSLAPFSVKLKESVCVSNNISRCRWQLDLFLPGALQGHLHDLRALIPWHGVLASFVSVVLASLVSIIHALSVAPKLLRKVLRPADDHPLNDQVWRDQAHDWKGLRPGGCLHWRLVDAEDASSEAREGEGHGQRHGELRLGEGHRLERPRIDQSDPRLSRMVPKELRLALACHARHGVQAKEAPLLAAVRGLVLGPEGREEVPEGKTRGGRSSPRCASQYSAPHCPHDCPDGRSKRRGEETSLSTCLSGGSLPREPPGGAVSRHRRVDGRNPLLGRGGCPGRQEEVQPALLARDFLRAVSRSLCEGGKDRLHLDLAVQPLVRVSTQDASVQLHNGRWMLQDPRSLGTLKEAEAIFRQQRDVQQPAVASTEEPPRPRPEKKLGHGASRVQPLGENAYGRRLGSVRNGQDVHEAVAGANGQESLLGTPRDTGHRRMSLDSRWRRQMSQERGLQQRSFRRVGTPTQPEPQQSDRTVVAADHEVFGGGCRAGHTQRRDAAQHVASYVAPRAVPVHVLLYDVEHH
eukprot:scaffold1881_cov256-Pinguiococcus_pyrenoidosus.AAC.22